MQSDTLEHALESLKTIVIILNNHKNKYSTDIIDVLNDMAIINKNSIPMTFVPSTLENQSKIIFTLGEKKDNTDGRYSNYEEYSSLYNTAETSINNYNSAYNAYADARELYKTSESAYNNLVSIAKTAVTDFQDDYTFQNTYNRQEINNNIGSAINLTTNKADYESKSSEITSKQTQAQTDFDALNAFALQLTSGGTEYQGGSQQETNRKPTIYLGDPIPSDLSELDGFELAIPANTTELDLVQFVRYKKQVQEALDAQTLVDTLPRTLTFAGLPASVTKFKLDIAASGKSNIDLMKEFVDPNTVDVGANKTAKSTEVLPGVNIVTYSEEWSGKGSLDNILHQAFEFTDKTADVTMPSSYNLTGAYKGGIIGDNVTLKNLSSSTISGDIMGKRNIAYFYNMFVNGKSASELATLDLGFSPEDVDVDDGTVDLNRVNLYNTKLDDIVKAYVYSSAKNKFSTSIIGGVFSSRSILGNNTMYNGDNHSTANVGEVDINTVLLTSADLSSIKVVGENKVGNKSINSRMRNVRFDTDMTGINLTQDAEGVVEFKKDAPASLYGGSLVIFKKVSHETTVGPMGALDIRNLEGQASNIKAEYPGTTGITHGYLASTGNDSIYGFNADKVASLPYTRQQYEEAANQGKYPGQE